MELMKSALKRGFPRTYNRVRECKYALTSRMFSPYTVKHTYGGHGFEAHIVDSLARGWYDRDWERLDEINMLGANGLRSGCLVFDLGAHQNVVAMMWAKEVGPSGTVTSVEASRHNFEVGRWGRQKIAERSTADPWVASCRAAGSPLSAVPQIAQAAQ